VPDERERRVAANEILFRTANDRIRELDEDFDAAAETVSWVCECADGACAERIELPLRDYERVREHPARFVVRPGHDVADLERIVEERDDYVVVEKRAGVGRAAAQLADRE
jgi:hypothetical protein